MKQYTYLTILLTITLLSMASCRKNDQQPTTENNNKGEVIRPLATEPSESDRTLERILEAIADAYGEDYLPDMVMDEEMLEREFPIERNLVEAMKGVASKINVHPDRVLVVRAVDGKGEEVERQLRDIHAKILEDPLQYAMNLPKIQAARVVRNGDYVSFLLVGAYSANPEAADEELLEHFRSEVSIGVEAFEEFFGQNY